METLSIKSHKPFCLELIQTILSPYWRVEASTTDTLIVHGPGSRVYLHPDSHSKQSGLFSLLLDYSDIELVKGLVEKIADDSNFTVDNDFDTVLPGNQFVARLKAEKNWDWRR